MKKVKIGTQTWSSENLAVIVDKDGNELELGKDYFYPNGDETLVNKYGLLYTWEAAMRVAPKGWHLPSNDDWNELENYCSNHYAEGKERTYIAKALASTENWLQSDIPYAIGNNPFANNKSGFNALPAGNCNGSRFYNLNTCASFWSATSKGSNYAYVYNLLVAYEQVYSYEEPKCNSYSVRYVRNYESS